MYTSPINFITLVIVGTMSIANSSNSAHVKFVKALNNVGVVYIDMS
jgi:hypothetical protein